MLFRSITSLLDEKKAPAKSIAIEYHQRWEIEMAIDEMDTHQRVHDGPLRSKKPVGVIQECYGLLIAHYVVRYFMHEAAVEENIDPDRLSFIGSLRIIRRRLDKLQMLSPVSFDAEYRRLIRSISRKLLPPRRNRSNPRVVRKTKTKYATKKVEHKTITPPRKTIVDAIVVLN